MVLLVAVVVRSLAGWRSLLRPQLVQVRTGGCSSSSTQGRLVCGGEELRLLLVVALGTSIGSSLTQRLTAGLRVIQ